MSEESNVTQLSSFDAASFNAANNLLNVENNNDAKQSSNAPVDFFQNLVGALARALLTIN